MKNSSGNFWGFGGTFVSICEKFFDVLMLGMISLVCCVPIVTAGASVTALYYSIVRSVKNNDGYAGHQFMKAFVRNLKPAFLLELIFVVLYVILQLNIGILTQETDGLFGLFFIVAYTVVTIYLILVVCYAFPALSRFDMNVGWIVKLSMYMVVRYLFTSIALLLILFCFGVIVWRVPVLIFIVPGPMVFVMSEFLEHKLRKHDPVIKNQQPDEYGDVI